MAIVRESVQQLHALPEEKAAIRKIIALVRDGVVGAGNPGHEIYRNRTSPFLPPAPNGHQYHEYRVGQATMPAGGFGPGTGVAGQRRLVLLLREYQRYAVDAAWVRPAHPGGAPAGWTRVEVTNEDVLGRLARAFDDNEMGGTIEVPAPPGLPPPPPANPQAEQHLYPHYRQIANRSFTRSIPLFVAQPGVWPGAPRGPGFYDLLVLVVPEGRIDVAAKYYSSEHYQEWVEIY
ncbi:MAG TPA: hypothetical protein VGF55_07145 [Gemmataceae bacterium]|jgi:hypothetical protein